MNHSLLSAAALIASAARRGSPGASLGPVCSIETPFRCFVAAVVAVVLLLLCCCYNALGGEND